jgi:AcrR family transcriptional regulator
MASAATAKAAHLQPEDWIRAAFARLSSDGTESVRVEILARDLGVSKGSFYWHFRDRENLTQEMLARWEQEEIHGIEAAADDQAAAARWARFVERAANAQRARLEVALRAWARRDERVAKSLAAIEKKKARFIADVLRDIGFTPASAESWSELVLLVCLGWHDLATRNSEFQLASRTLGEFLSELVLAASARAADASAHSSSGLRS